MKLINIGKNKAVVKFSTQFYSQGSVTAALTKYWDVFRNEFAFSFTTRERRPGYLTVVLRPRNEKTIDREKVYELCNFALGKETGLRGE